ncbi:sugar phosphate isomerase/epimerase [Roseibium sp. HPY-6]|uniref:sugar phosphate isomerase/epimerase family protein n=1 Tax=Roseibium sp. HPY-6 TaxID=3229852 RepID=UPI00338EE8FB
MIGLGSFSYRWSCGFKDRVPEKPLGLLDLLGRTERLGLKLLQVADNIPLHKRDVGEVREFISATKEMNIEIELGLAGISDSTLLPKYLDYAAQLDCRLLRASLDASDISIGEEKLCSYIKSFEDSLSGVGAKLALENHFALPSRELVSLVQNLNSEQFGICLDVANSICAGEWPIETIRLLSPYTINLHLKDCRFAIDPYGVGFSIVGTPLGTGIIDVPTVLDFVGPNERGINIILEQWLPWNDDQNSLYAQEDEWALLSVKAARRFITAPAFNA